MKMDVVHHNSARAVCTVASKLRLLGHINLADDLEKAAVRLDCDMDRLASRVLFLAEQCQMMHDAANKGEV